MFKFIFTVFIGTFGLLGSAQAGAVTVNRNPTNNAIDIHFQTRGETNAVFKVEAGTNFTSSSTWSLLTSVTNTTQTNMSVLNIPWGTNGVQFFRVKRASDVWIPAGSISATIGQAYRIAPTFLPGGRTFTLNSTHATMYTYTNGVGVLTELPSLNPSRDYSAVSYVPSTGKVLISGGADPIGGTNNIHGTAVLFDPTNSVTPYSAPLTMNFDHFRHGSFIPASGALAGKVIILGPTSSSGSNTATRNTSVFDPSNNTFSTGPSTAIGLYSFSPLALVELKGANSGKVLIMGFTGTGAGIDNASQIYDPSTNTFSSAGAPVDARYGGSYSMVALADGRALLVGGEVYEGGSSEHSDSVEIFEIGTGWRKVTNPMTVPRDNPGVALLPSGKVLIAGGLAEVDETYSTTKTAEIFDPASGVESFTATTPMHYARYSPFVSYTDDGGVIVYGGFNYDTEAFVNNAEIFYPAEISTTTGTGQIPNPIPTWGGGGENTNACPTCPPVPRPAK